MNPLAGSNIHGNPFQVLGTPGEPPASQGSLPAGASVSGRGCIGVVPPNTKPRAFFFFFFFLEIYVGMNFVNSLNFR